MTLNPKGRLEKILQKSRFNLPSLACRSCTRVASERIFVDPFFSRFLIGPYSNHIWHSAIVQIKSVLSLVDSRI